jgi:cytidyltransferase-like protein
MGGTFDPIHHGHLVAASEVAAKFDLDEVVFVPTGQPWQKSSKQVSKPDRKGMGLKFPNLDRETGALWVPSAVTQMKHLTADWVPARVFFSC